MRATPPLSLRDLDIWAIHADRCTAVLRRALELMSKLQLSSTLNEVALNREMYFCILAAQRELGARGQAPLAPVIPEGHNAPAATDAERADRENKIPDFQWGLTDDQVADVRKSAKHFVVECKKLAKPRRPDWIYTEQYVVAGARRFVTRGHGYGMGVRDGAMVGYVLTFALPDPLNEVAGHLARLGFPPLVEITRQDTDYVEMTHSLDRPFAESPFRLDHLWRWL